jgi:hypothetical protein
MIETIPAIPSIPDELRLAAREGRLVPFIGAGASKLASCPNWEEFAEGLLTQLVGAKAINYNQAQQIRAQNLSPRMKLSFVRNIAARRNIALNYEAIVHLRRLSNPNGVRSIVHWDGSPRRS